MHLLASMRSGAMRAVPQTLPQGLWDAASRKGPPASAIPRQLTGQRGQGTQSPLARQALTGSPLSAQGTGSDWLVGPQDKARFDQLFADQDKEGRGFITGDQAVPFFSNSGLSEDILATIWDLADINSEGQLNRDEFAVAMYLIRQERSKTTGRGNLPSSLPPRLVPPSMRKQAIPPSQPTAPAFDNAANAPQAPKSAADDLFGLDALSNDVSQKQAAPQAQDPFASAERPSTPASPPLSGAAVPPRGGAPSSGTSFKPFQPTSSFGQGLTQQSTGGSATSSQPPNRGVSQPGTGHDDLLGDTDPEVNKKFTPETTELANMSNQIGTLRSQMQDVQGKKSTNERDLAASSSQKQELEGRLKQFRTQYEQEVREVKSLEERLRSSRSETQRLSQDIALLEGTHADLKTQHQQLATALEADQRENAQLKQRTNQINTEVSQLRPALEKLRNDARQQKGMVAINKKQLATSEGERDKLTSEKADLEKTIAENDRVETPEQSRDVSSSGFASPTGVASPSIGSGGQSMNPFFRKSSNQSGSRSASVSSPKPDYSSTPGTGAAAFEDVFGTSAPTAKPTSSPPPTSFFGNSQQSLPRETPDISASPAGTKTPPTSEPTISTPQTSQLPPPPPESRQITSHSLPLRPSQVGTDSPTASVKVHPPASRAGFSDMEGPPTPGESSTNASMNGDATPSRTPKMAEQHGLADNSGQERSRSHSQTIPGSFPGEADTPTESTPTGSTLGEAVPAKAGDNAARGASDLSTTHQSPPKDDFESAFEDANLQDASSATAQDPFSGSTNNTKGKNRADTEFPPIQDIEPEESESESEAGGGFDDDFGAANAQPQKQSTLAPARPPFETTNSNASSLPPLNAQKSPPAYDSADEQDSSHFPKQYGDLLPKREPSSDHSESITSPPAVTQPITSPLSQVTSPQSASSRPANHETFPVSSELKTAAQDIPDDFDSAFEDLSEAKEDDAAGPDFASPQQQKDEFDFANPSFTTPNDSRTGTFSSSIQHTPTGSTHPTSVTNIRTSTESHPFGTDATSTSTQEVAPPSSHQPGDLPASMAAQSHDWDAIFSGLDNPVESGANGASPFTATESQPQASTSAGNSLAPPRTDSMKRPELGRAVSAGTEHDDPILKSLTGMGYAREKALDALEKFDYNLDKVCDSQFCMKGLSGSG